MDKPPDHHIFMCVWLHSVPTNDMHENLGKLQQKADCRGIASLAIAPTRESYSGFTLSDVPDDNRKSIHVDFDEPARDGL
ncbi:hypothetical protein Tco_0757611 [Tanacetum coccineum]